MSTTPTPTQERAALGGSVPSIFIPPEKDRLTIMSRSDNPTLPNPQKTYKGQQGRAHTNHRPRRLVGASRVCNCNTAIMRDKCQSITRGGKGNAVNPSPRRRGKFAAEGVEGETGSPYCWIGSFIYIFDECTEYSSLRNTSALKVQGNGK